MSLLETLRAPVLLSPVQLAEVWGCACDAAGVALLGRIAGLGDAAAEPRLALWLDFLYDTLAFGKANSFSAAKALAALDLIKATACHAVDPTASGDEGAKASTLRFLSDGLLEATKAMAPSDRYSLADVEAIMVHGRAAVVDHVKLFRLVYTTKQAVRHSQASYFVQRPALPLPLDGATIIDSIDEDEASPSADSPAATPAGISLPADPAPPPPAAAAPPTPGGAAGLPPPPNGDQISEGIGRYISGYLAQMQAAMEEKQAEKEAEIKQRIAELEAKAMR